MMKIKIIAPKSAQYDLSKAVDVFRENFSTLSGFEMMEGGMLDGRTFRLRSSSYETWGTLTEEDDTAIMELTEKPGRALFHCPCDLHVELLRAVRNMVEVLEVDYALDVTFDYVGKPNINITMAEDVVAMIKTQIHGFSKRIYINRRMNEPFFVLLGRDPQAPDLVRNWALLRTQCYTGSSSDATKVEEAALIADAMESYKNEFPEFGLSIEEYERGLNNKRANDRP